MMVSGQLLLRKITPRLEFGLGLGLELGVIFLGGTCPRTINDLSNYLKSESKLFADDTSLFSVVHDINISVSDLYDYLETINQ